MNRLLPQSTIAKLKRKRRVTMHVTTSVKLPRTLIRAVKAEARKQNRPQSFILREAISSYISFRTAAGKIE